MIDDDAEQKGKIRITGNQPDTTFTGRGREKATFNNISNSAKNLNLSKETITMIADHAEQSRTHRVHLQSTSHIPNPQTKKRSTRKDIRTLITKSHWLRRGSIGDESMSEKCASLSGEPKARSRGPDPKISSQRMRARKKGEGDGEIEARKYPNDAGRRRERGRGVSQLVAESAARAAREMAGIPWAYLPPDSLYGNELVCLAEKKTNTAWGVCHVCQTQVNITIEGFML